MSAKSRDSADDRRGDPKGSPFRRYRNTTRYVAALDMIEKRRQEIGALERLLARTTLVAEQRRLTTRLLASKNNLRSWQAYIEDNCPREPRAVITPAA